MLVSFVSSTLLNWWIPNPRFLSRVFFRLNDAWTRRRLLGEAEKAVRRIGSARSSWAQALQQSLLAGIRLEQGDRESARQHLEAAEPAFAASEMVVHAAIVRLRLAKLLGRGYDLADAELRDLGLVRPEGMAAILLPGSW